MAVLNSMYVVASVRSLHLVALAEVQATMTYISLGFVKEDDGRLNGLSDLRR